MTQRMMPAAPLSCGQGRPQPVPSSSWTRTVAGAAWCWRQATLFGYMTMALAAGSAPSVVDWISKPWTLLWMLPQGRGCCWLEDGMRPPMPRSCLCRAASWRAPWQLSVTCRCWTFPSCSGICRCQWGCSLSLADASSGSIPSTHRGCMCLFSCNPSWQLARPRLLGLQCGQSPRRVVCCWFHRTWVSPGKPWRP